jgi:site-specific DNA recombinase
MKAVIYARFSTELQNERSILDQVALCRNYAANNRLEVVAVFEDAARSGASILGRDGLLKLMKASRERAFDVVIVEALDRLSRDMADLADIHKQLSFLGIEIRAVHDGTADSILIGIRGLVGHMQREDGAKKVRRGMAGIVRAGRYAGGRAYGYQPVSGKPGELQIVTSEAEVVRRIFAEYTAGRSPRDIATTLNQEHINAPRGSRWNASTINGNAQRGAGIIFNELYVGRIVWNKVRMVKDPDTGKRVSRPNPPGEWQSIDTPHLRIVDPAIWQLAQTRKVANARRRPHLQRRPRHLLSGLLKCGICGSGMPVIGKDRSGRVRVQCSALRESGNCSHSRRYYLEAIEEVVVHGLRAELRDPKLIAEYVKTYHEEKRRLAAATAADRSGLVQRLGETKRSIGRLVDALADGRASIIAIGDKLKTLDTERIELEARLTVRPETRDVITLHPAAVARYLEQIENLSEVLQKGLSLGPGSSAHWFRSLVERVVVHPVLPRAPLDIEVRGYMAELLAEPRFPPNGRLSVGIGGSGGGT